MQFGRLSDLVENATALSVEGAVASALAVPKNEFYILELNRRRQLFFRGISAEGKLLSTIGGRYSPVTLRKKQGKRPANDAKLVDLFDTGAFYESFSMKLEEDGFLIVANTIKGGDDLRDRWGDELLGLTDESRELAGVQVQPEVVDFAVETLLKQ